MERPPIWVEREFMVHHSLNVENDLIKITKSVRERKRESESKAQSNLYIMLGGIVWVCVCLNMDRQTPAAATAGWRLT